MSAPRSSCKHGGPVREKRKRANIRIRMSERAFSCVPPIFIPPDFPRDINNYCSLDKLLRAYVDEDCRFPFERELVLYLLMISSIWPDNKERLLEAARIFCSGLNYHLNRSRRSSAVTKTKQLEEFNQKFFAKIGGAQSLLACAGVKDFYFAVWNRINELAMAHDVLEYLIKTASLPRINSLTFAYHAVAHNIFSRKGGYGVRSGPKRQHLQAGQVTTFESVRARCKDAPKTLLISLLLTSLYKVHFFDPTNSFFFRVLFSTVENSPRSGLLKMLLLAQNILRTNAAKQNVSIVKWTDVPPRIITWPIAGKMFQLSFDELERALKLGKTDLAPTFQPPLSALEEAEIRERHKNWWR